MLASPQLVNPPNVKSSQYAVASFQLKLPRYLRLSISLALCPYFLVNCSPEKGERWDLNPRPLEPQSSALPTELRSP